MFYYKLSTGNKRGREKNINKANKATATATETENALLHKIPDMHYVKNTLPSHHVKHNDTRVPPN
jgi:hypothetical protein